MFNYIRGTRTNQMGVCIMAERNKGISINVLESISKAIENPDVPKIYANSFSCALGTSDIAILLNNGSKNVGVLSLSFTSAKSLSIKLQQLISHLETASDNKIMTSDEIHKYLIQEEKKDND